MPAQQTLKHIHFQLTRHGKRVVYFRRGHGLRVRLPGLDDPNFAVAYAEALATNLREMAHEENKRKTITSPTIEGDFPHHGHNCGREANQNSPASSASYGISPHGSPANALNSNDYCYEPMNSGGAKGPLIRNNNLACVPHLGVVYIIEIGKHAKIGFSTNFKKPWPGSSAKSHRAYPSV